MPSDVVPDVVVPDVVPDVVVPDKDEVSDDELGFQTTEVAVSSETRVEQVVEGVRDDTVSMPGRKRKISDEVEILNEVSTPPKKVRDEVHMITHMAYQNLLVD